MKDTVLKLVALSTEMHTLMPEIDKAVREKALEFAKLDAQRYGDSMDYPTEIGSIGEWHFEGDSIRVQWQEYWNYGGHADGCFVMPAVYLYDDAQWQSFKGICEETVRLRKEAKALTERTEKLNQIKRLQAELDKQ